MLDYTALATLAAILRTGSFDAASAQLNVTPSAVSQRIKALEDRVGAPLLHRTQPVTATALGARLVAHVDTVAALEQALLPEMNAEAARPTLRIALNADSLGTWVLRALAQTDRFLFDLVIDDQDHSADWLRRGEVHAAITGDPGPVTGCVSQALGALRYRATASPGFIAQHFPDGITQAALRDAPCLTFNVKDRLQAQWVARNFGPIPTPPTQYIASTTAFVEAAERGLGWGMNPESLVRDALARGRLVDLAPAAPLDTPLFWQVPRALEAALSPLTRAIRQVASEQLWQQ